MKTHFKRPPAYQMRLIGLSACLVLAALLVALAIYFLFNGALSAQIQQLGDYAVSNAATVETRIRDECRRVFDQMTFDNQLTPLLYSAQPTAGELLAGLKRLDSYREPSAWIDSLYIYNAQNDTFYVSSEHSTQAVQPMGELFDMQVRDLVANCREYQNMQPISRTLGVSYPRLETLSYVTYLRYNTFPQGTAPWVLVINVRQDAYFSGLWQPSPDVEFRVDCVDKSGVTQLSLTGSAIGEDLSGLPHIRRVLEEDGKRGFFHEIVDGQSCIVFFDAAFSDYWTLCYAVSQQYISSLFGMRSQLSSLLVLLLLLIALVSLAGMLIRRLMRYQRQQQEALEQAHEMQRERAYHERCARLRRLLSDVLDETERQDLMHTCDLKPVPDLPLTLITLQQRQYNAFCRSVDLKRQELIRFSVCSLAFEIAKDHRPLMAVDGDAGAIYLLTQSEHPQELGIALCTQLNGLVDLQYAILVSHPFASMSDLPAAYRWAQDNLPCLQMHPDPCVIDYQAVVQAEARHSVYPDATVKQLLSAVMTLDMQTAGQLLHRAFEQMTQGSYKAFRVALMQMLVALDENLTLLCARNGVEDACSSITLFGVAGMENIQEMEEELCSLLEGVEAAISTRREDKYIDLLERVDRLIEERISDALFGVNELAEAVAYTSTYIGRLYRRYRGVTLSESMLRARMERARALLAGTDLPINQVAEQSGFADATYFYRAFKKANGVTPNVYRQNNR